jgi:aspartyl-tRNA synthetase
MSETALLRRTVGCGEVGAADAAATRQVVLTGWVHRRRDLGRLVFVELRDATGFVQVVFDPSESPDAHRAAEGLRNEDVVGIGGRVVRREAPNPRHPTGEVEVRGERVVVHNKASVVPLPVEDDEAAGANEEARLTHRYLDLRRPALQRRLRLRHRLAASARRVLDAAGFVEIETPMLTRSTPEGARDYLVPSRVHPGSFYALPQSPQLFKQLLMVAGFDRYYQFARCFRDEDLRADRQPEFTQIDVELSFATPELVYELMEAVVAEMFLAIGVEIPRPFPRMSYAEAIDRFGTDRPDARFGLELRDAGPAAAASGFTVFEEALAGAGGAVRGIALPGAAEASRKQLDTFTQWARDAGARGLVWIKLASGGGVTSSALKALGEERCTAIARSVGAGPGDLALLVADSRERASAVLGALRLRAGGELGLIPQAWRPLWVEDFPLLQWDAGDRRWVACHHPFTAPRWEQLDLLEERPGEVRAQAYDLVLNGTEIAGGSIRIHRRDIQERVFRALSIGAEEGRSKFGFLLRALEAGAPPHGGIALGFDRACAMLAGVDSIREVIAFPKTTSAACLMTGSPAPVDARQLAELGLGRQESK